MRTSIDFPDELLRHLKARAALEGTSMREMLIAMVERGLAEPSNEEPAQAPPPVLPSITLGSPFVLDKTEMSSSRLSELADE